MIRISVKADVKRLTASLDDIARKQIPFATARAINDLAFQVQRAERDAMPSVFRNPRPFTTRSVLVDKATKSNPTATVSVRPEVAKYLAPYEFGGRHVLPGRALLDPKGVGLDQYGQLRQGTTRRLKARKNVFVGRVHGVAGFWQRARDHHLKLLIRFGDAVEVRQHLDFRARAEAVLKARFGEAFRAALEQALATARRR